MLPERDTPLAFLVPSLWPWEEQHALLAPLLTYIACHFLVIFFIFEMIAWACDSDHFSITLHLLSCTDWGRARWRAKFSPWYSKGSSGSGNFAPPVTCDLPQSLPTTASCSERNASSSRGYQPPSKRSDIRQYGPTLQGCKVKGYLLDHRLRRPKYHHRGTLLPSITRGGPLLLVTTFYKLRRFTVAFTTSCVSSTETPTKSSWHLFCPVPLAYFHFKSPCPVPLYGPIASIWRISCHGSLWRHCTWCSCRPGGHAPTLSWGSSDLRALTVSDRLGPSGFACCHPILHEYFKRHLIFS